METRAGCTGSEASTGCKGTEGSSGRVGTDARSDGNWGGARTHARSDDEGTDTRLDGNKRGLKDPVPLTSHPTPSSKHRRSVQKPLDIIIEEPPNGHVHQLVREAVRRVDDLAEDDFDDGILERVEFVRGVLDASGMLRRDDLRVIHNQCQYVFLAKREICMYFQQQLDNEPLLL